MHTVSKIQVLVLALWVLAGVAGCTKNEDALEKVVDTRLPEYSEEASSKAETAGVNTVSAGAGEASKAVDMSTEPEAAVEGHTGCPHKKDGSCVGGCPHKDSDDCKDCPFKKAGAQGECPYGKHGGCGKHGHEGCPSHRDTAFAP